MLKEINSYFNSKEEPCNECRHCDSTDCTYDFIDILVAGYKALGLPVLNNCIYNKTSITTCVWGQSTNYNGNLQLHSHPHQKKIDKKRLSILAEALEKKTFDPDKFESFEQVFDFVKKTAEDSGIDKGFGQITIYDTALRFVASAGFGKYPVSAGVKHLMPKDMVYLHRGALLGMQALWGIDYIVRHCGKSKISGFHNSPYQKLPKFPKNECKIPVDMFSDKITNELKPYAIEDFLCVCHPILHSLYMYASEKSLEYGIKDNQPIK